MFPKPLFKWAGGKTQLLEKIVDYIPKSIQSYHEPFIGGGSVLFALLYEIRCGNIILTNQVYAYDANETLVHFYKNVQTNHVKVLEKILELKHAYNKCPVTGVINRKPSTLEEAKVCKENYYYWIRSLYNKLGREEKKSTVGSAIFLFLNKTCFRGLFRVGPNGFNVPYGHYHNPEIINRDHIQNIHDLIQGVVFECCDFTTSLARVTVTSDFVYIDPPYVPETNTSFVNYTENGFNDETHKQLFEICHKLPCQFLLSNSNMPMVRTQFDTDEYNTEIIECKRTMNSKHPQTKTQEVLIERNIIVAHVQTTT